MPRVLFVCSKNRWRSPTAEQVFADYPGVESASASLSTDADNPLTPELLDWAELVFVMQPALVILLKSTVDRFLRLGVIVDK